ncbi:MAG: ATP-binding protein [Firmicutes bacterium]|nr:ATP-binding protein [Bacillota bacterium]
MENNNLKIKADSLAIFREVRSDKAMKALLDLIESPSIDLYSQFISLLYPETDNISEYVKKIVLSDDNFYVKNVAAGREMSDDIKAAVTRELNILEEIASISSDEMQQAIADACFDGQLPITLPAWKCQHITLADDFNKKIADIPVTGYGMYARYNFFRISDGKITPVTSPDFQRLDQLFEYERERNLIIKNTEALVSGKGASNMLLYGDMGTGKSSTIKAVAAHYADQGLRIIEIKKEQLFQIPEILEELSSNPLKFILFIDDLSFTGNDDNFSALKATLEGSVAGCGDNVAIFATSNRRHLVKESMSDRTGEEIHVNDTIQETMSLAARFGLTITFMRPEKDNYLSIVRSLADEYGILYYDDEDPAAVPAEGAITLRALNTKAEAFAIRHNGRSPRTARQFIELLKIGI